jgi:hypothetical protein
MMPNKDPIKQRENHRLYLRKRLQEPEYRAKHMERVKRNNQRYNQESRELIAQFKSNGCSLCPEKEECCLSAHHLDPTQKEFNIASRQNSGHSRTRMAAELSKCLCLCENCHRKVHAGILALPAI